MGAATPDFFDQLVAIDWTGRFESFADDDWTTLRLFDDLAHELGQHQFFAQPQRFSLKAASDGSYESIEHAGADALRSMAMTFRQLWSKKEPAQFHAVLRLLRSRASGADTVAILDELGVRYRDARRHELMKHIWADDPMGKPKKVFRATEVIDDWFNGGAFHSDLEARAKVNAWPETSYEWSLIRGLSAVAGVMWELQVIVGGILADEPVRT